MKRFSMRGFTLIELVIVIIILGILAAIALPRFVSLQREARIAVIDSGALALKSGANIVFAKMAAAGFHTGGDGCVNLETGQTLSTNTCAGVASDIVRTQFGYPRETAASISPLFDDLSSRFSFVSSGGVLRSVSTALPTAASIMTRRLPPEPAPPFPRPPPAAERPNRNKEYCNMKTTQQGFTLVELVMVIVILGILGAVAVPRFINLGADARIATVNGLAATLRSASNMTHAQALTRGATANSTTVALADSTVVQLRNFYPRANLAGINNLMLDPGDFTSHGGGAAAGATRQFRHSKATTPTDCRVDYTAAQPNGAPVIETVVTGC